MEVHRIRYLLEENPKWLDVVREASASEERFNLKNQDQDLEWLGFEWHEVHAQPATLNKMVSEKVLDVSFNSRSSTHYKISTYTKQALQVLQTITNNRTPDTFGVPDNLFSPIVGYDDVKAFLLKALKGESNIHFLFEGPPATAKSLFMLCIQRAVPRTYYATGSRTTAAGLTDALLSGEPRVLLLDEIEKADMQSYAVLLSLMENRTVVETKYRRHTSATMNTVVMGSCNNSQRLPPELISRFDFHVCFSKYTKNEFVQVCREYLSQFEGVPAHWAGHIGVRVWNSLKIPNDIRKARGVAKILDVYDQKSIDEVIRFEEKYSSDYSVS